MDHVYLSADGQLTNATLLATVSRSGTLGQGQMSSGLAQVTLPVLPDGDYQILVVADATNTIFERNLEGNNLASRDIAIRHSDLVVSTIQTPSAELVGNPVSLTVMWTIENQGTAATYRPWTDHVYFSSDTVIGNGDDVLLGTFANNSSLAASATTARTATVNLPGNLIGEYFLYIQTDATDVLVEPDGEENNTSAPSPVQVVVPFADLFVDVVVGPNEALSGDPLSLSWRVRNQGLGTTSTDSWVDRIYISDDDTLDGNDLLLTDVEHQGILNVGSDYAVTADIDIPYGLDGQYWLFVVTDADNAVFEHTSEGNNTGQALGSVDLTPKPLPNLQISSVTSPTTGYPRQQVTFEYTTINVGEGVASGFWIDRIYLSRDGTLGNASLLATRTQIGPLASGGSRSTTATVTLPEVEDGDYFILVQADGADVQFEENDLDNLAVATDPLQMRHANLTPTITNATTAETSGNLVTVEWQVENTGGAPAIGTWTDQVYLSSDQVIDSSDTLLQEVSRTEPLGIGESYTGSAEYELPLHLQGTWYFLVRTDVSDGVAELGDESDNLTESVLDITLAPYADLIVSEVVVPVEILGDPIRLPVQWTIANQGTGIGRTTEWVDEIVLSNDSTLGDSDDVVVGRFPHSGELPAGESYTREETVVLPARVQGYRYIYVKTDADGEVFEFFLDNNNHRRSSVMRLARGPYADLTVTDLTTPEEGASSKSVSLTWTVENIGIGPTSSNSWDDRIYLARNPDGSSYVADLARVDHVGILAVGDTYTRTASARLPNGIEGTYYLVVEVFDSFDPFNTNNDRLVSGPLEVTLTPPPDLVVATTSGPTAVEAGDRIDVTWSVLNQGVGSTSGSWNDSVLLRNLNTGGIYTLGTFTFSGTVMPGQSYVRSEQVTIPARIQGAFELYVRTNSNNRLYEHGANGNNNGPRSIVEVSLPPRPDLQVFSITAPEEVSADGFASLSFVILNQGPVGTPSRWQDRVYLSTDAKRGGDILLGTINNASALESGESYASQLNNFRIPKHFGGNVYLLVETDSGNRVDEYPNETNNLMAQPIYVEPLPPADLVTSDVVGPSQAFDGSTVTVSYKVTNLGEGETAVNGWYDSVWLTRDRRRPSTRKETTSGANIGKGDILLSRFYRSGSLKVGESYQRSVNVRLPSQLSGEWFLTVWSDVYDNVLENTFSDNINPDDPNELDNNNYKATPITVLLKPPPDLVVTDVTAPTQANGGESYRVTWTVQNQGSGQTQQSAWYDNVYLSDNPTYNESGAKQWYLGRVRHSGHLGAGEQYTQSLNVTLSPKISGQYVHVVADASRSAWEGPYEDNNVLTTTTDVTPVAADLRVTSVTVPDENLSGESTNIEWTVENVGAPVWTGTRYWVDYVYISQYPDFSSSSRIGSYVHAHDEQFLTGNSYTGSVTATLPRGIEGEYYIRVRTDVYGTSNSLDNSRSGGAFSNRVYEGSNEGGQKDSPIQVTYYEPDLHITNITPPTSEPFSGEVIPVTWTVENIGVRATRESTWFDRVFLSRDATLDDRDHYLGQYKRRGSLATDARYTIIQNVRLPEGIDGDFYLIVFTDANQIGPLPPNSGRVYAERYVDRLMARVQEFADEGNNITSVPLTVNRAVPPDLQVTEVVIPQTVFRGQTLSLTYTVSNESAGRTPDTQSRWDDYIYLSRDPYLDTASDIYLGRHEHTGGLSATDSYQTSLDLNLPSYLLGEYYVFVLTDPPRPGNSRGNVFELSAEGNNSGFSPQPLLIRLPPPSDLQVDSITVPASAQSGDPLTIDWTVTNHGEYVATGSWADAAYLSADETWDIGDAFLGRVSYQGQLQPGQSYTSTLTANVPPVPLGQYRIIVRPDIFNEINEAEFEANNRTTSADELAVTVEVLTLGVPHGDTLDTGESKLFQVTVGPDETLRVSLDSAADGANEIFVRHGQVPDGITYDVGTTGPLQADQSLLVPSTKAGTYYILVRNISLAESITDITLLVESVPLSITNVTPDSGGDSKFVTLVLEGAQFKDGAIVKLVRPNFAEIEPANYRVLDSTQIKAIFDFSEVPRGLYDVKVINPDGETVIVPYRYLVARTIEPDVNIGVGGSRVLAPGDVGTYSIGLQSLTNVDTPYVFFQFGIPELGLNENVFNLRYVTFTSNVGGSPPNGIDDSIPWAQLDSTVNTNGTNLAPGFVTDFAAGDYVGLTFNAHTYPGLKEILDRSFDDLRTRIEEMYPEYAGLLDDGPEALDEIYPGLFAIYQDKGNPLAFIEDEEIAFSFHVVASATTMTREEFIAFQSEEALTLRDAILADDTASQALTVLAADADDWTSLYLAALEEAGLLRPEDEGPPIRENPEVVSLMAVLASGILAGSAGEEIITDGNLVEFFETVRSWYGHDSSLEGSETIPDLTPFDLQLESPTQTQAFNIYVPYGDVRPDEPGLVDVAPPDFASLFDEEGTVSAQVTMTGPQAIDAEFLPAGARLPYTIHYQTSPEATSTASEVQIVSQLDDDVDPRTFRLGDLKVGDIRVHIPSDRGYFQGDFDLRESKGFILRVTAGLDVESNTATWLLQAIDPETGEVTRASNIGLLPANNARGDGAGFVTYSILPKSNISTGADISVQARMLLNNAPPLDSAVLTHLVDAVAPTTNMTVEELPGDGTAFEVHWQATDDETGSGVRHVTVYVAEDGGDFTIWLQQTQETMDVFQGESGKTYEFLALATDNAGNKEQPPLGILAPDDGSAINLGATTEVGDSIPEDVTPAPQPPTTTVTNPIFLEAEQEIPANQSTSLPTEFTDIVQPFAAQAFAHGFTRSHADIGPMAILELTSGEVLISGGSGRNLIYRLAPEGGNITEPWADLPHPIFDLAEDTAGRLWAATGGGPLLQLSPIDGSIISEYGDSITQAVAVDFLSNRLFVSSSGGVESFDPRTGEFTVFSEVRVGSLAFGPDGQLWATSWPDRGKLLRFDDKGQGQLMVEFDTSADSLAFGQAGTVLDGLLFVSHNHGKTSTEGSPLTMIDLATMNSISIAMGGTRGDVLRTTRDGRLLLSQSNQVDQFFPVQAPQVVLTNPPDQALVALPRGTITVSFDQPMLVGSSQEPGSVLNPGYYQLLRDGLEVISSVDILYNPETYTVNLEYDALSPGSYSFIVAKEVRAATGYELPEDYAINFTAVSDFSTLIDFTFSNARSERSTSTVSYDVTVANTGPHDLVLPLFLVLDPAQEFEGQPLGAIQLAQGEVWLLDLSDNLPTSGVLQPGETTTGRTVSILNPQGQKIDLLQSIYTLPVENLAPSFLSDAITIATMDATYQYQAEAEDSDGVVLSYLLYQGPEGMTVDSTSGLVSWSPEPGTATDVGVILRVYDSRGGYDTQSFTIAVAGGNTPPELEPIPAQLFGAEGSLLEVPVYGFDVDGDSLVYWVENLPPGAIFDHNSQVLLWTPGYEHAGTYENVRFYVSDGFSQTNVSATILITPASPPPTLHPLSDMTVREGDPVTFRVRADDFDGLPLTYLSTLLPGGATLHRETGEFHWTPTYFQAGVFDIPFSVTNGEATVTENMTITVLNVNAAPEFDSSDSFAVQEGQNLVFRVFANDPDNPGYVPPNRLEDGSLVQLEESPPATLTYSHGPLPESATFDAETGLFGWLPGFDTSGSYTVTFTATDDGNGTGVPLTTTVEVPITIHNTNRSPVVDPIENQTIPRGEFLELPISASDPDGNPVSLSAALPEFITLLDNGDGTGILQIAPGETDRGNHVINILATDDGDSGQQTPLVGEGAFVVTVDVPNEAPVLQFIPDRVVVVGETLEFLIETTDLDQDPLSITADSLPPGATLTPGILYGTAVVQWTPATTDIGTHSILMKVTDSGNGTPDQVLSDEQVFTLTVRESNSAPILIPVGDRTVREGEELTITLAGVDADSDKLYFSATNLPQGAKFNGKTGVLTWTPGFFDSGVHSNVLVSVEDGSGSSSEVLTLTVENVNRPPILAPVPVQSGREKTELKFTVAAGDFDGQLVTYTVASGMPVGGNLDPTTGEFSWLPDYDQAGDYTIQIRASDAEGLSDTIDVIVSIDDVNRAPTLDLSNHSVAIGDSLSFVLDGDDPDTGAVLSYSASNLPDGATFDTSTGSFAWTPTPGQEGDYVVDFSVTDGTATTNSTMLIRAETTPTPPTVQVVQTPSFAVAPGAKVLLHPIASSLADIVTLELRIDGQPVALNNLGRAEFIPTAAGKVTVEATAVDADGRAATVTHQVKVLNSQDNMGPVVGFAPGLNRATISSLTPIVGTIQDTSLDRWVLEIAPLGQTTFRKIASAETTRSNQTLASLDPGQFSNGLYRLRLTGRDLADRVSREEITVEVRSANKAGQFLESVTDLTVDLDGVSVDIVRNYDSLARTVPGTFGFGWRLTTRDFDIRTDVPNTGLEAAGGFHPYRIGTRLYLTVPDGRRVGFTFTPQKHEMPGLTWYTPAWTPDPGAGVTLSSAHGLLTLAGHRLYDLKTARPYHPADGQFDGPAFRVTTPDGTIYQLSAEGHLVSQITAQGEKLTYSDSGIVGPDGGYLRFLHNSDGFVESLIAPDGTTVRYEYNEIGQLIAVRNLSDNSALRYGYGDTLTDSIPPLTIISSDNQPGTAIEYDPTLSTTTIFANLGSIHGFTGTITAGTVTSPGTDFYSLSVRASELASVSTDRVLLGVSIRTTNGDAELSEIRLGELTPVLVSTSAGRTTALFAVTDPGQKLLQLTFTGTGDYELEMFLGGDVNADGAVDGVDAQLQQAALGTQFGDIGYLIRADVDGNGTVDGVDVRVLAGQFGFVANRPPIDQSEQQLTHVNLGLDVSLESVASDREGDAVSYRIMDVFHGSATLSQDGQSIHFIPTTDFFGTATVVLSASD